VAHYPAWRGRGIVSLSVSLYEIAVRVDRRCEMKGSDFDKAVASMRDTPKIPFTTIAVGQRVRVRFLQEYGDRLVLWRHERVPLGNGRYGRVTCFLNEEYKDVANGHCPYCAEGYRRKAVAFWLVWNHDTKRVEILSANQTAFSFVSMVKEFAEMQGTITDRDWIITRKRDESTGGDKSRYTALPGQPLPFSLPEGTSVPTYEDLVAYLAPRELRGQ
jgi:hypothetical protein